MSDLHGDDRTEPTSPSRPYRGMSSRRRGAVAAGGGETSRRGAGLLGLLVLPLLLALLVIGLVVFADEAEDGEPPRASTGTSTQQAVPAGSLDIGGTAVPTGASLRELVGQTATVRGAEVVQVLGRSGFFVGGGPGERTFVEWGPRAGGDEATTMPKVGDRVDLTGPIERPPEQPGRTFGIPVPSEKVILEQGGYINADRVDPAS